MQAPPPADDLAGAATISEWPPGTTICRAHSHLFGSGQLDDRTNADSRFSTIFRDGQVIPVLYGGENDTAAASETIFHTVDTPTGGHRPRYVFLDKYRSWQWSTIATMRTTTLVAFDDDCLDRFGVTRAEMIEGGRLTYPQTRAWARAIAEALPDIDGLRWESRQSPTHWAVMLFGRILNRTGGIRPGDLHADTPALPFESTEGLAKLDEIADNLRITVIRS